jgi:hypothetical protein
MALLTSEPLATAHTTGSSRSALTPVTCCAFSARSSPSTPAVFFAASLLRRATSSSTVCDVVERTLEADFLELDSADQGGLGGVEFPLETGQFSEPQGAVVAQRDPDRDVGAALFDQALARGVPQRQAAARVPLARQHIQGPDLAGGVLRFRVTGAVKTDKTDDTAALQGDMDLGFAVLDGVTPESAALLQRQGLVVGRHDGGIGGWEDAA